jgi:hypothetical protein
MNNQENKHESNSAADQSKTTDDAGKVNIHPSESENGAEAQNEENAPGRTPGKAEGSSEIVEADLEDKKI